MEKINLNSVIFNTIITKEDILKHVTQEDIYSFYMEEDVSCLGLYNSPLRNDQVPSFNLYFHKNERNTIMFKDYATGESGDFTVLVMKMFNIDYKNALRKIAFDLGLSQFNVETNRKLTTYTKIQRKESVKIGVRVRRWSQRDKKYWKSYGISKKTLVRFNVHPISYIFYNDTAVPINDLAYCYIEEKDNNISYKIYQPFAVKNKKWITNTDRSVHQGYTQLPDTGDLLIITKSLKDVMSIYDTCNIPAIGLQSESVTMKQSVMDEYLFRFKKVLCLFDNDLAGIKLSNNFSNTFDIPHFFMPVEKNITDFSDYVKEKGVNQAKNYLTNEIKKL